MTRVTEWMGIVGFSECEGDSANGNRGVWRVRGWRKKWGSRDSVICNVKKPMGVTDVERFELLRMVPDWGFTL